MGQPVKLSDELVCQARVTAALSERSIAGQIEFWAQLGRSLEPLIRGDRVVALRRAAAVTRPLSEAITAVDTEPGQQRVRDYLRTQNFPRYEPVPGRSGVLRRIEEGGRETIGRFVGSVFEPLQP